MHSDSPLGSACIEHVSGNQYRCRNRGIVFTTDALPIYCCSEYKPTDKALTECLEDRYEEFEDPSFLRPREQVDALLANCETNPCKRFDPVCQLCKRIVTGCAGIERWIRYLTDDRKWCKHWGPEPKNP